MTAPCSVVSIGETARMSEIMSQQLLIYTSDRHEATLSSTSRGVFSPLFPFLCLHQLLRKMFGFLAAKFFTMFTRYLSAVWCYICNIQEVYLQKLPAASRNVNKNCQKVLNSKTKSNGLKDPNQSQAIIQIQVTLKI